MYNTGELSNFDPSMLQPSTPINVVGVIAIGIQVSIILFFFIYCAYKIHKNK